MTTIPQPPLLLDNDRLRDLMREREQQHMAASPLICISGLLKPAACRILGNTPAPPTARSPQGWPQQEWPDCWRQLHWELSSSTLMRPLARLMQRKIILPDPFMEQGGWQDTRNTGFTVDSRQQRTGLAVSLRLDIVLCGTGTVHSEATKAIPVAAGDAVLAEASHTLHYSGEPLHIWTALYYAPDLGAGQTTS